MITWKVIIPAIKKTTNQNNVKGAGIVATIVYLYVCGTYCAVIPPKTNYRGPLMYRDDSE